MTQRLQLLPVAQGQPGGEAQEPGFGGGGRFRQLLDQRLQGGAALAQRSLAPVVALPLQQVVGHENRRTFRQESSARGFAAQAPLQLGEGGRPIGLRRPHQDLAVEHRAIR